MAIMRVKDKDGKVHEILVIRGEDYILTEQDKEDIAGMITKEKLLEDVLDALPVYNGEVV